jgi:ABC-type multidrug transport system fused ATPase/permease subunit
MEKTAEIVERGSHIDLLAKNGAYAKLHTLQFSENHSTEK